ncbi:hypothetical protein [Paraglaciecola sp. 2405UD69-4]|uniref:hypothetical protein n=1 Tax=Paraglaciecola sp. 2405UD69-4 TaxID=3391836 RepID=UPI0039C9D656
MCKLINFSVLLLTLCLCKFSYANLVLNFNSDGKLTGASGVDLGYGEVYDVEFARGSCVEIFGGCDDPEDLFFNDVYSAIFAGKAFYDQVLVDGPLGDFSSDKTLIADCDTYYCHFYTPFYLGYYFDFWEGTYTYTVSTSIPSDYYTMPDLSDAERFYDTGNSRDWEFAQYLVWSEHVESTASIPAPPAIIFVFIGAFFSFFVSKARKEPR